MVYLKNVLRYHDQIIFNPSKNVDPVQKDIYKLKLIYSIYPSKCLGSFEDFLLIELSLACVGYSSQHKQQIRKPRLGNRVLKL